MLSNSFWKGKKVLVTGHTGFKGSWLVIWLRMLGAEVTGYALEPITSKDNFVVAGLDKVVNHNIGDIRNFDKLTQVFHETNPEIVFHLAAQPLVLKSYAEPKETFDINIGGTVNILECSRNTQSVKVIINVTTDKCYDDKMPSSGYIESNRLGGYDPYSSSKAGSEIVTKTYRNSFFNPNNITSHNKCLSSVRAGNVIGGGDWNDNRLIPDCIRALQDNCTIEIRNPDHCRPWQYVLEPIGGYLLLAKMMYNEPRKYCGAWNFAPPKKSMVSVKRVVDLVVKSWGSGEWSPFNDDKEKLYETKELFLDATKSRERLGWKSECDIVKSIDFTMEWYKIFPHANMLKFCETQIENYISLK